MTTVRIGRRGGFSSAVATASAPFPIDANNIFASSYAPRTGRKGALCHFAQYRKVFAMKMEASILTPAMVVNVAAAQANIDKYQKLCNQHGCAMRPHIKTHKMISFARKQLEAGAIGITCAKLSEAELMADAGVKDIFLAFPVIGERNLARFLDLAERIRMIAAVDSDTGVHLLNDAAARRGMRVEVRLEIDTGYHRTGVLLNDLVAFAQSVAALPALEITGIFTYKSQTYRETMHEDRKLAAKEEAEMMLDAADRLRQAGIPIRDLSGGSTPTADFAPGIGGLTEMRFGSYIFQDAKAVNTNAASEDECAARVMTTVVSTPASDRAIIDAGSKAFGGDAKMDAAPHFLKGYGRIAGRPDLTLRRVSEEHGMVYSEGAETGLRIGDRLQIIPNHICTAFNLFNHVFLIMPDGSVRKQAIDGRGMSY